MIKSGLIVSCQALPEEPLHSSFIMARMALAAMQGGAIGIRANSVEDILEIKKIVSLPIIGIIKKVYADRKPYITPTYTEIAALSDVGTDIIALDATFEQDEAFLKSLRATYPNQEFMADISTVEEGLRADYLGFDYIGTTLVGYTDQSKGTDKFDVLRALVKSCGHHIIAEGNFNTPPKAAIAKALGAYAVVVGSAITRPQYITKQFAEAIDIANNRGRQTEKP